VIASAALAALLLVGCATCTWDAEFADEEALVMYTCPF